MSDVIPESASPPPPATPRRRVRLFGGFLRGLVLLGVVALVGGGVAAFGLYQSVAKDLPDHTWLANY